MLHVGHIRFFKMAKENCDYLIVAVCPDEMVKKYKGYYPIISLEDRKELLEHIDLIDLVIEQTSIDRMVDWRKYHFDVYFHGDDGLEFDMKYGNYEKLVNNGITPIYFPRDLNISSTNIKKKIVESIKLYE